MQEYKSDKLVVRYDPKICIHAGNCVRELPAVFDTAREPWIAVHGAPIEEIVKQVQHCPSGALSYEILEKG
ncbi:MAG: (4Fe-4S)-binding protein [Gammaproteobacteria bacterium]